MYYLNADTLSYLVRSKTGSVHDKISDTPPDDLAISTITAEELISPQISEVKSRRDGKRSFSRESTFFAKLVQTVGSFNFVPYSEEAERLYQSFDPGTRRKYKTDARLAAHAYIDRAMIVTNNTSDFRDILSSENLSGIQIENWTKTDSTVTEKQ